MSLECSECERDSRSGHDEDCSLGNRARIKRLERELTTAKEDTARLDWLQEHGIRGSVLWRGIDNLGWVVLPDKHGNTVREAIDNASKEGKP